MNWFAVTVVVLVNCLSRSHAACAGSPPTAAFSCGLNGWQAPGDVTITAGTTAFVNGSATVAGNLYVQSGARLTVIPSAILVVQQSVKVESGGTLEVDTEAQCLVYVNLVTNGVLYLEYQTSRLVVTSCAYFNGTLIVFNHTAEDSTAQMIQYSCYSGAFLTITVVPLGPCWTVSVSPLYTFSQLTLNLAASEDPDCDPIIPGMTREQALGLLIGVPLGLLAVTACVVFFVLRRRQLQRESRRLSRVPSDNIPGLRSQPSSSPLMVISSFVPGSDKRVEMV